MKLIVGLGNPGDKYKNTRHNIGFEIIDQFVKRNDLGNFDSNTKLRSELLKTNYKGEELIIIKPNTFMNNSGEAASIALSYYKLTTEDLIVINDDLDIDISKVKLSKSGSSAGHRGVQSIVDNLGSDRFVRVRVGIGHPRNSNSNIPVEDYVLMKFDSNEQDFVKKSIDTSINVIDTLLIEGVDVAMNKFN